MIAKIARHVFVVTEGNGSALVSFGFKIVKQCGAHVTVMVDERNAILWRVDRDTGDEDDGACGEG